MFSRLSIKQKLLSSVIIVILSITIIIEIQSIYSLKKEANSIINNSEKNAYIAKEKELENYVSLAYKTIESYYERTAKDKIQKEVETYLKEQTKFLFSIIESEYELNKNSLSQKQLEDKLKSIIRSSRFGKTGYFFAYLEDGTSAVHGVKPSLEGKNLLNIKDPNGVYIIKDFIKVVNTPKTQGFTSYLWPKPGFEKPQKKISYVKLFKPFNWIIGTGAYVENVEKKIKQEALTAIQNMRYGKNGYFWINNSEPKMLMHPIKPQLIGKDLSQSKDAKGKKHFVEMVKVATSNKEGGLIEYYWNLKSDNKSYKKYSYVRKFEPWDFIIGTGELTKDIEKEVVKMREKTQEEINSNIITSILIVVALIVLTSILIILLMNKIIIKPLTNFQDGLLSFFKYINKEQREIQALKITSNDEIGKMASLINDNINKTKTIIEQDNKLIEDVKQIVNTVGKGYLDKKITASTNNESLEELKTLLNNMLENIQKLVGTNINTLSEVLEHYSNRDFTKKIDESTGGKIGSDILNLNKMITNILQDNQNDGLSLQEKSTELTSNVKVLNENANSQAASLEETAASIEQITSNIKQTSQKAQTMLDISSKTQKSSDTGKNLATKTVKSMDDINETVENINEAITVIDQIAFQTNILSLNAAVEAATAGEAGKGFAVVAQEVRNLAARSAEAAKEIKDLVETATLRANDGKQISSSMIEGFNELEKNIKETSNLIDDVTNASKEQSAGISQISDAVNQLDKFTQENASIADRTNTIALETNEIAQTIVKNVDNNNFEGKV